MFATSTKTATFLLTNELLGCGPTTLSRAHVAQGPALSKASRNWPLLGCPVDLAADRRPYDDRRSVGVGGCLRETMILPVRQVVGLCRQHDLDRCAALSACREQQFFDEQVGTSVRVVAIRDDQQVNRANDPADSD